MMPAAPQRRKEGLHKSAPMRRAVKGVGGRLGAASESLWRLLALLACGGCASASMPGTAGAAHYAARRRTAPSQMQVRAGRVTPVVPNAVQGGAGFRGVTPHELHIKAWPWHVPPLVVAVNDTCRQGRRASGGVGVPEGCASGAALMQLATRRTHMARMLWLIAQTRGVPRWHAIAALP